MKAIHFLHYAKTVLFAVALALLIGLVLERAVKGLIQYLDKPTYTETLIVPQYHAEFPSMSICPLYNGYKTNVLLVS